MLAGVPVNGHSVRQVTSRLRGDGTMARLTVLAGLIAFSTTTLSSQLVASQQIAGVRATGSVESADQLMKQGHIAEAIQALVELASSPQPPKGARRELGIAYYRSGQLKLAEKQFMDAMSEDPTDSESDQMLGLTLYRLNRRSEALPYLERAHQSTQLSNIDVNYIMGRCYIDASKFDEARVAFATQFGITPNSGSAHLLLAQMLLQVELADAAAVEARKALELSPGIALAHFALGKVYLAKGNTDEALKEFESEVKVNPSYPELYQFLGDLYIRTNQVPEAQQALTNALALDQSSTGPFILMGRLFLNDNDPQTAATYLEHAEQMDSSNVVTHYLLAQAYRRMGRKNDAERELVVVSNMHSDTNSKGKSPD